jgi:hypothetical protein
LVSEEKIIKNELSIVFGAIFGQLSHVAARFIVTKVWTVDEILLECARDDLVYEIGNTTVVGRCR